PGSTRSGREAGSAMHSSDWTHTAGREFRAGFQKIPLQIISLIECLSRSRHRHGAPLHQIQEHCEREDAGAIGVWDVEALVFEPPADVRSEERRVGKESRCRRVESAET